MNNINNINEEMRNWSDLIQTADIDKNIEDSNEQTLVSTGRKPEELDEAPVIDDAFLGKRKHADDTLKYKGSTVDINALTPVADHGSYKTYKNPKGNVYLIYDMNNKPLGMLDGTLMSDNIIKIDVSVADSSQKGIMSTLMMDILKDGKKILSDTIHSPLAKRFWERLIKNPEHLIYVTIDGEIVQKATEDKLHKYWTDSYKDVQAGIQFLMVK